MPAKLAAYARKRDFSRTPEPSGEADSKFCREVERLYEVPAERPIYVVQKHAARALHWDLRLEFAGVLRSWAVTKEPKMDPAVKRLAIHTEDHPLAYASFSGTIPSGYGAGTVEIWDRGTFDLVTDEPAKLVVDLHGKKLSGKFALIKTRLGWLFFKMKD